MKNIRNQKGGVLPYVLMIMMLIMVFTPVLLSYGSNQQLSLINRENENKAYMLAISGMEAFISYIESFDGTGDKESYFNNYSGWGSYRFTTPEGDSVKYILEETNRVNYISTVTSTAEVGTGNQKKSKSVSYSFDLSPCRGGPYITTDPTKRKPVPENFNTIYVQGSVSGKDKDIQDINVIHNSDLRDLIGARMNQLSEDILRESNQYNSQAEQCNNCSINEIQAKINGSSSNSVIIKVNNLNLSNDSDVTFGSTTKAVILIVDKLTASKNVEIYVYGTLIVLNSISENNNVKITTYTVSNSYGDLWVTGPISIEENEKNNVNLNIAATLYANSLTLKNNAKIHAKNLVINGMLDMDNNAKLIVNQDIFARSFQTHNNPEIVAAGDLFVENNLETKNNMKINTGGLVAVGGDVTFKNNIDIQIGGGTTSLILNPEEGDNGGCQENPNWNIGRIEYIE